MSDVTQYEYYDITAVDTELANADGSSRQTYLRQLLEQAKSGDGKMTVELRGVDRGPEIIYQVQINGVVVGCLPADFSEYLYHNWSRYKGVTNCKITQNGSVCGAVVSLKLDPQPLETPVHEVNENKPGYVQRSKLTALLLCLFLGTAGVHRFYVGKIGTGVVWLLTAGCFGIGWIIDIVNILSDNFTDAADHPLKKDM
jgi:hypothetical protein